MNIRTLKANEIECRVGNVKQGKGFSLLLYKDARCDMKILDETFGWDGWKREHNLIDGNLHCTVSVWSEKRNEWIEKQDVGTESNTEKEKGQASDAFKRACVNFGIGRELYTAPFIWISESSGYTKFEKFFVKEIGYNEDKEINRLVIIDKNGKIAFNYGKPTTTSNLINEQQLNNLYLIAKGMDPQKVIKILNKYGFKGSKEITKDKYEAICNEIVCNISNGVD